MAITILRLVASGPNVDDALIEFDPISCLIRGPSETGKSYIRDCLWYLMGGTRRPKPVPQDEGYTELRVDLSSDEGEFRLRRALAGGEVSIHAMYVGDADYALHSPDGPDAERSEMLVDEDVGDLLVRLSGASGMQVLRSASKRGGMTGADLRHWFLLSQPAMISEDATSGSGYGQPQRLAAFHVFLGPVLDFV